MNHNDFESGDDEAYTVGPFEKLPAQFKLFNNEAGGPEIGRAIAQSAIDSVRSLAETVGDSLLGLVAGHADKVGTNRMFWNAEQLAAIPAAGRAFTIAVNGGDEGHYRLDGRILKTAESHAGTAQPWHEFRVQLTSLYCIREGSVDRLSPSEEPYVLALLVPFPGNIMKYKTAPIRDTDTGETKRIGYTFPTIRVPKNHGMLSLPISIWESDSESETSRRQQLDQFAGEASRRTGPARQGVLDALGAAVAADWEIGSISVYAFNRGGHVLRTGKVYEASINAWLKGKERRSFPLDAAKLKAYPAVDARTIDVIEKAKPSPVGYGYEFDGEWDIQFHVNSASVLQRPLRTKIRLVSTGNRVEGFYDGPVLEVPHLTLRPGRIFEGEVVEHMFEGNHLYNLKGVWRLETGPNIRQMYTIGESFPFEFDKALGDPFERELFLGIGRVHTLTLDYKNGNGKINVFPSVSLSRTRGGAPLPATGLDRASFDLNGIWGYGPSHGGDYYRVDSRSGR
ncbi:MAG TPA: hypothetical protein PLX06_15735, partial [Fimbriimonadaceae bacterium]|nr:hypothetical protein [Fimbriimonadaceae bacterium]